MNIEGLDYNTQRDKLLLPEYGREVQKMVDHAKGLKAKADRQRAAAAIIEVMARMNPAAKEGTDYRQKLWDHLAIISGFSLDIDYPVDVTKAAEITQRPERMGYPGQANPVRHYGGLVYALLSRLRAMPQGRERDELLRLTANQMKRDLMQWSHGSSEDEKVADDIARLTDGEIRIDLKAFKFNVGSLKEPSERRRSKKK